MKTYLECIPCFFKQALEASRIAGTSEKRQKKILIEVAKALEQFPLSSSPPEMGRTVYGLVKKISQKRDPYKKIKEKSNKLVSKLYGRLKKKVSNSSDRLLQAVELAIAGNIIDFGTKNSLNVKQELKKILSEEHRAIKNEKKSLFRYDKFKKVLKKAKIILYIADNVGETFFDKILIKEIKKHDKTKKIIYAVRANPVINDALAEDARKCGMHKLAHIVSSGSDAPGAVLNLCSKEFLQIFYKADMVISKGQGNFEALSDTDRTIFFLFMAKCPVIAKDINCNVGDIILKYKKKE